MSERARLAIALVAIYLVWGSTYLAIAIGVRTLPPLAMASARFATAGIALYGFLRARGVPAPSLVEWRTGAITAFFLLLGGNGVVSLNARALPSGIVALLIATTPLFMVLLPWLARGPRPRGRTILAIGLGLLGVAALARPGSTEGSLPLANVLAIVFASASWSVGSLVSKRLPAAGSPMMATAQQMTAGGVLLFVASALRGELGRVDPSAFSTESLVAFAYLTIVGSITGFGAYVWLLRNTSPAVATSYAYVNPLVALVLGHLIAHEPLGPRTGLAAALIVGSVVLLVTDAGKAAREAADQ
ncbi:MAG: EamA family transporter [Polyangiales bacterium]